MNQLTKNSNQEMAGRGFYRSALYLLAFVLLLTVRGISAPIAAPGLIPATPSKDALAVMTNEQKMACIEAMKERVAEIRAMDKSALSKEDRKALRTELKQMNKEARTMRREVTGVYISIGALIIIILLLIIIL
jgi:hypothetical protein